MTRARLVATEILLWAGVLGTATGTVAILLGLLSNEPLAVAAAIALTTLAWAVASSSHDDIRSATGSEGSTVPSGPGSPVPSPARPPSGEGTATQGGAP